MTPDAFAEMLASFYPYRERFPLNRTIPEHGIQRDEILQTVTTLAHEEDALGDTGKVSGSLYLGDHEQYHFLTQVFEAFAHANVLQRDMYPSATKFEGEIVAMTAKMLNAPHPVGVVTSGGSESLMTQLFVYRERARTEKGITKPEVIIPASAHVAIDKAAHYFDVAVVKAPLTSEYIVDVEWVADHITDNTVALVGSAGSYPYGLIDPIEELGALALRHDIGLHIDGCLGGFVLPWGREIGVSIPAFDFAVEGVTSISADTHKFGYALKGTSVLLYRTPELRQYQYFTSSDWPGGMYISPGMSGSRSGGVIAATWAALLTTGRDGYLDAARRIFSTAAQVADAVRTTDGLRVCGDPTFLIAFESADPEVDIYLVNDALSRRGWRMNANQRPPGLHFCITLPNTRPGLVDEFRRDLSDAVAYAREHVGEPARSGALYGMSGTPAGDELLPMLLAGALDAMYEVPDPSMFGPIAGTT